MRVYSIECDHCGSEARIIVKKRREEPEFCPMCGTEAYVEIWDEDTEE